MTTSTVTAQPLTAEQQRIETLIDGIQPSMSQEHKDGTWVASDSTLRGSLATTERFFANGFGRRFCLASSLNFLGSSITGATAATSLFFQMFNERDESKKGELREKLHKSCKFSALGLAYGAKELAKSVVCDPYQLYQENTDPMKDVKRACVLVIDVQYSFFGKGEVEIDGKKHVYEDGSLAVKDTPQILPVINGLLDRKEATLVKAASQDWHPLDHGSFAKVLGEAPFSMTKLFGRDQVAWPVHCVQGSKGAEFVHGLHLDKIQKVVQKGLDRLADSYSAFFDNGGQNPSSLHEWLQSKKVDRLYVAGIATDYCVNYTVRDALRLGYKVSIVTDGCKGVGSPTDPKAIEKVLGELKDLGATLITSSELPQTL